jgi:hypothetical protein
MSRQQSSGFHEGASASEQRHRPAPEAKNLLFVKLPDRIVLIDPDTKLVAEIVVNDTTTGSNPNSFR